MPLKTPRLLFLLCLFLASSLAITVSRADDAAELSAALDAPAIAEDGVSVRANFILTNHSQRTLRLYERINSWGAWQWKFIVTDAVGKSYELENPQCAWWSNMPASFTILAGETHVMPCRLFPQSDITSNQPEDEAGVARFCMRGREKVPAWKFPLALQGKFQASVKNTHQPAQFLPLTNWHGELDTPAITISELIWRRR